MSERDTEAKRASWVEHTVVANLPRVLPLRATAHTPLSAVDEPRTLIGIGLPRPLPAAPPTPASRPDELGVPFAAAEEARTVVGAAPSSATARQLLARYAALSSAPLPVAPVSETPAIPPRMSWFRRAAELARDDFRRAPRIVRLLLPALPLVAAATTFLDVDPAAPALSRAVAVAATSNPAALALALPSAAVPVLPLGSVAVVRHAGRTLAAEAADAAARGDRARAIAIYAQLAREHPDDTVYASAARILMRDEERNRPHPSQ